MLEQGLIHQTRMALSPVGTQADVDLVASIYEEPWWLEMLGDHNLQAIWHKVWVSISSWDVRALNSVLFVAARLDSKFVFRIFSSALCSFLIITRCIILYVV